MNCYRCKSDPCRCGHTIYHGNVMDVLPALPDSSVNCCVTSPPYWGLRDYGCTGQIGLEGTPEANVARMVEVFSEVRRVLRDDGTCWVNLGDSYAATTKQTGRNDNGQRASAPAEWNCRYEYDRTKIRMGGSLKPKDLCGIPWRVAFALQADGWFLRQEIIWSKPSPMPESVKDRCTKSHEYIFLLTKSANYYYDAKAIAEPVVRGAAGSTFTDGKTGVNGMGRVSEKPREERETRNKRSVWTVAAAPFPGAHFATFPPKLIEPCILAGCPEGGVCLDPFFGAGTTALVSQSLGRRSVGIELNEEYIKLGLNRIRQEVLF